jgi:MHS family proline/betaine transporter-like MFS transporter
MNINKDDESPFLTKLNISKLQRESTIAGIGIALEYYSIFLFGYLAFMILPQFFLGSSSSLVKLSMILESTMGVIGAIACGQVGDTLGRKKILAYTVACVAFPSFFISLLPGCDHIGITASLIFMLLRSIQMLAFGGDMIGLVTFILEDAPASQRGRFGGYMSMSAGIGVCLASLLLYLLDPFKDPTSFWKWRLLLIFGVIGIFIANYLKKTFGETEIFKHYKERHPKAKPPIIDVLKKNKLVFLRVVGLTILAPIITIVIFGWIPQFSVKHLDLFPNEAMLLNAGSLFLFVIGAPLFGRWSDRWGRKWILIGVSSFFLAFSYFLFKHLSHTENILQFFIIESILAFVSSAYYGVAMTASIEHIPTHIRYTGVALAYYTNYAIFGGISGNHLEKLLIKGVPLEFAPVFYLLPGALVVLICSIFLKEEAGQKLSDKIT